MNPLLTAILSFVAASGLVFALTRSRQRSAMQARLERITGQWAFAPPPAAASAEGNLRPDVLPTVTRWLSQQEWEPRLRLSMLQADLRLRPAEWVALCAGAAVACFPAGADGAARSRSRACLRSAGRCRAADGFVVPAAGPPPPV